MSDREHSAEILEHSSGHQSVEEKSASRDASPTADGDIERHSHSRSRSRSRSHSFSRRRRSYSRSRSHSRSRKYRHYGSRSRSRSPKHHRYSRSRSRSYSPRRSYSPQYSPRHSYYGEEKYYGGRYGGKGKYGGRSYARSPMSSRRRHVGNRKGYHQYENQGQRARHVSKWRQGNSSNTDNPEPSRCLGVFGLSLYTQERELREVFGKYGPIEDVQVVYDAQSGRSRGFAFVYFEDTEDAKMAKERCNGQDIDGRKIRVDYSITKRAHTPTPGIYMGKPTPRYGGREGHRDNYYRDRHSPSPYYRHRYSRSRSRSYSPRKYGYY